jgi:hypothetical protein
MERRNPKAQAAAWFGIPFSKYNCRVIIIRCRNVLVLFVNLYDEFFMFPPIYGIVYIQKRYYKRV